jgi:hypothetical protein
MNEPFKVNINFDDSSKHWRENKTHIGNGVYVYICTRINERNDRCILRCLPEEKYCKTHLKMFKAGKFK